MWWWQQAVGECVICCDPVAAEAQTRVAAPCGHGTQMHQACLYTWSQKSSTCPVCRGPIFPVPHPRPSWVVRAALACLLRVESECHGAAGGLQSIARWAKRTGDGLRRKARAPPPTAPVRPASHPNFLTLRQLRETARANRVDLRLWRRPGERLNTRTDVATILQRALLWPG